MKHLILFTLLFTARALFAQHLDYQESMEEHRKAYKADFLTDPRSPLTAADTAFLDFYPVNPAWAFPLAKFKRTPEAKPFEMMTYSGQKRDYVQFGTVEFKMAGKTHTLNIYQNLKLVKDSLYRDHLFLPFKDLTNGGETYGGGRYLDLSQSDIMIGSRRSTIQLDFNKCYNPWCAFSDGYNCPIPPRENHLDIEIPVGERNFKGVKKH